MQSIYKNISLIQLGFFVFCIIIAVLVTIFLLSPMMQFGGDSNKWLVAPVIPDDIIEELKKEISSRESVITFKDTYPEYRERYEVMQGLEYYLQARNSVTGNSLHLTILHHAKGPLGITNSTEKLYSSEDLNCIIGENMNLSKRIPPMMSMGSFPSDDMFIDEAIKTTRCLDDDWKVQMIDSLLP